MSDGATRRRWARANKEKIRLYNRRQYRKNAEKQREHAKAWYAAHPEAVTAKNVKFRAKNPNYWRERWQRMKVVRAWRKFVAVCAANRVPYGEGA
jgi:hypothetical protein